MSATLAQLCKACGRRGIPWSAPHGAFKCSCGVVADVDRVAKAAGASWGYPDFATCVRDNSDRADAVGFCTALLSAASIAAETDQKKKFAKVIKSEAPMGGDWLVRKLREERNGVRADDPHEIQKGLEHDVDASSDVTTPKPSIVRLVKSRAYEWKVSRGLTKADDAALLAEAWASPLSGIGDPTPDDPSLHELFKRAPESDAAASAVVEKRAEAQVALQAFDRFVDSVQKANPSMSRPACVSKALADETGVQLYRRYQQCNAKLDRARGAQ